MLRFIEIRTTAKIKDEFRYKIQLISEPTIGIIGLFHTEYNENYYGFLGSLS